MELPIPSSLPYDDPPGGRQLQQHIASLLASNAIDVKLKAFAVRQRFDSVTNEFLPSAFTVNKEKRNVSSLRFVLPYRRDANRAYDCEFLVQHIPALLNVIIIISDCCRETFKRLCKYLRNDTRFVVELGVNQRGFRDLIMGFRNSLQGLEMRANKVVKRPYIYREKMIKHDRAEISWGSYEIEDVFERAQENNWWFKSISYALNPPTPSMQAIRGSVSRSGFFNVTGAFNLTYENLIIPFCRVFQSRYLALENRARIKQHDYEVHPFRIEFYDDVFDMPSCNNEVIEMFRQYRSASVSVMHGNPYMHLSIVDFIDGSSYDVLILNRQSLTVIPQLRATPRALQRICEYIWDNFTEGVLREEIPH